MIPYEIDQLHKEQQQEAEAAYYQERWEQGYDDAGKQESNCCKVKTANCSLYCAYLAGYLWGLEQATSRYHAECTSNLATLDSEDYEF